MAAPVESWFHVNRAELKDLVIAVLAMAFAFGWKFAGPATFGNWLGNFIIVLFLVGISVLIHEIVHKFAAKQCMGRVHSKLFTSAVIVMLIITILTNGNLVIAVPWVVTIIPLYFYRPGKPYPKYHLGPRESAFIAAAGPLTNFFLAVVAKMLIPSMGLIAEKLMAINISLAVFNLLPFLTILPNVFSQMTTYRFEKKALPYVEGEVVFFGSRLLWCFTFSFVVIGSLCLLILGAFASLLVAFIIAGILWFLWHFVEFGYPAPAKPI